MVEKKPAGEGGYKRWIQVTSCDDGSEKCKIGREKGAVWLDAKDRLDKTGAPLNHMICIDYRFCILSRYGTNINNSEYGPMTPWNVSTVYLYKTITTTYLSALYPPIRSVSPPDRRPDRHSLSQARSLRSDRESDIHESGCLLRIHPQLHTVRQ